MAPGAWRGAWRTEGTEGIDEEVHHGDGHSGGAHAVKLQGKHQRQKADETAGGDVIEGGDGVHLDALALQQQLRHREAHALQHDGHDLHHHAHHHKLHLPCTRPSSQLCDRHCQQQFDGSTDVQAPMGNCRLWVCRVPGVENGHVCAAMATKREGTV